MPRRPFTAALLLALSLAQPAGAACFADYKAKQDRPPLRLAYGVAELPEKGCADPRTASAMLAKRLAAQGWTLLTIMSVFGPEGLEERKASAGDFFLRY